MVLGKTTVEMIEGLRKPDGGSIIVYGIEGSKEADKIKELLGVQLQSTSIYEKIRVREVIDLFGSYYQKSVPTAKILDEVSLTDKEDSFVETLGQFLGSWLDSVTRINLVWKASQ